MIGQTLGHYILLEKIGGGAMGEVYRARDQHLERDVALKILPSGFLADQAARKRFRGEALALSKLNHPNIATVFDFDTQEDVDFLAMELIDGTALSDRLKAGPLSDSEVVRIGMQLADGLAAAHDQGLIHRDLKPGNLMITPDGRLKILDFGLAVLAHPQDDPDLTRNSGEMAPVAGTVPYMPPEQLRGEPTDARSDIYAAGAVLYEMATGLRPFPQSQSAELIGAILYETPAPPSTHHHRMAFGLESLVMKALDKDPARRHQTARELLAALEGADSGVRAQPLKARRMVAASMTLAGVLLTVLAIGLNVGGLGERVLHRAVPGRESPNAPVRARRSVAVLGFKNLSGRPDQDWLSTAISEMLTTELAAGEHLRTIPGENISQMKINLSLTDAESYGKETLSKIRTNLRSDHVVLGSYVPVGGGQIRLDVRLQDAVAGETLAAISEKGSETQIDELVSRVGSVLRKSLGAGPLSAAEAAAVKGTVPSNPEVVRLYTEGLAKLRMFDALAARDLLENAVTADPEYSLAHGALSRAWSSLGYDERAKAEAKRAFELSANLSREERLLVEATYRETTAEREKASEIYRTLWRSFPDNLDYGLQLADVQIAAGKGRDALITVEGLRKLPPPAPTDPRIDLTESAAASSISDFNRQMTAAEKAAVTSSAQGARLLVARAQLLEGRAFLSLGQLEKATAAYNSAKEIFAGAGDRRGVGSVLRSIGTIFYQRGDLSKAEEMWKQALAIQREIGDKRDVAASLNNLGAIRYKQNNLSASKKFLEDALEIKREIDDRSGVAQGLNNIAALLHVQGDLDAAKKMYKEALVIHREIGNKTGAAITLNNIGEVLSSQADLSGAKRSYEEALNIRQQIGDKGGASKTLTSLGELFYIQGNLTEAHKKLEEALAVSSEIEEKGQAAECRRALAAVLIEEGQATLAEMLARLAAEEFQREKAAAREAVARQVIARSQLQQGRFAEAQKSSDEATKLLAKSDNRVDARLSVFTTAARVRAVSGESLQAVKNLEGVIAEAKKFHLVDAEFDARLALGEIEMKSGKTATGRARLAALENDASAKGFLLTARKAHAAAGSQ